MRIFYTIGGKWEIAEKPPETLGSPLHQLGAGQSKQIPSGGADNYGIRKNVPLRFELSTF
jgi:hypothetical protein